MGGMWKAVLAQQGDIWKAVLVERVDIGMAVWAEEGYQEVSFCLRGKCLEGSFGGGRG